MSGCQQVRLQQKEFKKHGRTFQFFLINIHLSSIIYFFGILPVSKCHEKAIFLSNGQGVLQNICYFENYQCRSSRLSLNCQKRFHIWKETFQATGSAVGQSSLTLEVFPTFTIQSGNGTSSHEYFDDVKQRVQSTFGDGSIYSSINSENSETEESYGSWKFPYYSLRKSEKRLNFKFSKCEPLFKYFWN